MILGVLEEFKKKKESSNDNPYQDGLEAKEEKKKGRARDEATRVKVNSNSNSKQLVEG